MPCIEYKDQAVGLQNTKGNKYMSYSTSIHHNVMLFQQPWKIWKKFLWQEINILPKNMIYERQEQEVSSDKFDKTENLSFFLALHSWYHLKHKCR